MVNVGYSLFNAAARPAPAPRVGPRPRFLAAYGITARRGPTVLVGAGGIVSRYPSGRAAFKANSFKGRFSGPAANGPLPYALKAPLRGAATGGAYTAGLPVAPTAPRVGAPPPLRAPLARAPAAITLFSVATLRARRGRRAAGVPRTFYRVKGKRRVGSSAAPPAGYPRAAALGAPRGFSLPSGA